MQRILRRSAYFDYNFRNLCKRRKKNAPYFRKNGPFTRAKWLAKIEQARMFLRSLNFQWFTRSLTNKKMCNCIRTEAVAFGETVK